MHDYEEYVSWLQHLLQLNQITVAEKKLLKNALNRLEKNKNLAFAMYQLKKELSIRAIKFELSPALFDFYQHLNRYFSLPGRFAWLNFFKK